MAKRTYDRRRIVATGIGTGLVAYSAWLSWLHFQEPSAPIAAVVGATLFHFSEASWGERARARSLAFFGLGVLAVAISLSAVLDRTATVKDRSVQERQAANTGWSTADQAARDAREEVAAAEAAASSECSSGRGPRCRGLEERVEAARKRLSEARTQLVAAGAPIAEDSGAKRLAALLPITEANVSLYQPLMLPVWLELGGLVLLTYGLSSVPQRKKVPSRAVKKRRKATTKRTNVLPLRARNDNLRIVR